MHYQSTSMLDNFCTYELERSGDRNVTLHKNAKDNVDWTWRQLRITRENGKTIPLYITPQGDT